MVVITEGSNIAFTPSPSLSMIKHLRFVDPSIFVYVLKE